MIRRPEFPDLLACTGMPSVDGQTVELRVVNEENELPNPDFTVSIDDLTWVNMPSQPAPEQIDTPEKALAVDAIRTLFQPRGLALVACRVLERQPGYVIVAVPAVAGASRITAKPGNLARPFKPSTKQPK